jgi:hypothetical protein
MSLIDRLDEWVHQLATDEAPSVATISEVTGIAFEETSRNAHFVFYEGRPTDPFTEAELRAGLDEARALLVLEVGADAHISEDDLALTKRFGKPTRIDVNPRVPPEGVVEQAYAVHNATLGVVLTAETERVQAITLSWGMT